MFILQGTFNRYVVSQQDFHILRALKQVNATMKEMDRKILSIDKKVEKTATEETTFADIEDFPVSFPLANVEEFIKLEDILNEDPSKAAIVVIVYVKFYITNFYMYFGSIS